MATKAEEPIKEVEQIQIIVDRHSENYATLAMLPLQNISGEINYVIVVQEDYKPVINTDIKEKINEQVYVFEDNEEELKMSDGDNAKSSASVSKEQSKRRRDFQCSICSYTANRRYLLMRHVKSHSEAREHTCEVCKRGFKTVCSLQNHVNTHYGVKPHVCKYCKNSFTTSGELVRHVRYKHTHEKPHKCNECDYASVELSKLRRHLRCHTGERPYQCSHCTYASADTFKLKRHLRTHTGEKPYKCDHCNMNFNQSNTLKSHKRIHSASEKPVFACAICPTKCGRMTDLRIHIQKLHTSTNTPLKCNVCGQMFSDRYSWKVHLKTHKGEKCFKCDSCPFAGSSISRLKTHMLKHMDSKPFACDQCDQCFRQKQLLRRHQNLYHKPGYVPTPPKQKTHICHKCGRTFAYPGNLSRHITLHEANPGCPEEVLILDRIDEVQYVSKQPKEEPEVSNSDQMTGDNLNQGKKITLYDEESQSYFVIEVLNYNDESEPMTDIPVEFTREDEQVEEEEVEPLKNIKNVQVLENDVDTCFGFDV